LNIITNVTIHHGIKEGSAIQLTATIKLQIW
jgi:hypothetical protein